MKMTEKAFARRLLLVFMTTAVIAYLSYSQTRRQRIESARAQIELLLSKSDKGPDKELGEVIDVDSSIGVPGVANGQISDPYGTLKGCYLFMATTNGVQGEDQRHSIGVYRAGQIVWMSDQLPGSENYGYITDEGFLATKDLNHQRKVDIVVYFSDATNPPSGYYLWVFSWDGKKGRCINQCDKNGETDITSTGSFDIVDVDNDGIDEIRSYDGKLKVNAIYSWNGKCYAEKTGPKRPHHQVK